MGDVLIVENYCKKDGTLMNLNQYEEISHTIKIRENLRLLVIAYIQKGLILKTKCQVVRVVT